MLAELLDHTEIHIDREEAEKPNDSSDLCAEFGTDQSSPEIVVVEKTKQCQYITERISKLFSFMPKAMQVEAIWHLR